MSNSVDYRDEALEVLPHPCAILDEQGNLHFINRAWKLGSERDGGILGPADESENLLNHLAREIEEE